MKYLSLKDQSEGAKTRRGTWADDEEAREHLKKRAKAMLLEIEKRQRNRHKKVRKLCILRFIYYKLFDKFNY